MLTHSEKNELKNELAAVFSSEAEVLWISEAWGDASSRKSVMGFGWMEFVVIEDVPRLRSFFSNSRLSGISFRGQRPSTGTMNIVTFQRAYCRGNWLVAVSMVPDLTPPVNVESLDELRIDSADPFYRKKEN